jgi:NADPH:quinone reductase
MLALRVTELRGPDGLVSAEIDPPIATTGRVLRCMAPEGRLLVIGFADGRIPELPVNRLLLRHLDVIGVNYGGFLGHDLQFARRAGEQLYEWARSGAVAPVIGPSYPLEQGAQALRDLAERRAVGKPVLIVR